MSNLPAIKKTTDLTTIEINKVEKFIESGMPNIGSVTDAKLHQMFDLYLNGSSYTQISSILEMKKVLVLYFAHTCKWYETKQEYMLEMTEKINNRVIESKLKNKEFILLAVQAWQKKISHQLQKYLSTNDPAHMDEINLKEMDQLMKAIDRVNEMDNTDKTRSPKAPLVGLNLTEGMVVERNGENQVIIKPKETTVGEMLQQFADEAREKERVSLKPVSKQGENDESK